MDLTNICKMFHPPTTECTFSSAAHRTFSKIDHILGDKTNLNKYKKFKNNFLHFIRLYWNETGSQQEEKLQKYKHMEKSRRNKKIPRVK
jgi:hypothetical protein